MVIKFKYFFFLSLLSFFVFSQKKDSLALNKNGRELLFQLQQARTNDSLKLIELSRKINEVKKNEKLKKEKKALEPKKIQEQEAALKNQAKLKIEKLKLNQRGFPVTLLRDTLFFIYGKTGALMPVDRAHGISERIYKLYEDDFFKKDSLIAVNWENEIDIIYNDVIIMSISDLDALRSDKTKEELAQNFLNIIQESIAKQKQENSVEKLATRIALVILVFSLFLFFLWIINKIYLKVSLKIIRKKGELLKNLSYKGYTFLSSEQELKIVFLFIKGLRLFLILILLYILLSLVFSFFPLTQTWAGHLLKFLWLPTKSILIAIWKYLPNLFSIVVIFFIMKYCIRLVRFIFKEIELGKLEIAGFHPDWAMPTFNISKMLLYALMFILMFPYFPGSDSNIFKGVSVFIGVLFSVGSSSAISNMVAGLVITYMRPFKVGDQIKIADMTGIIIEKNMLVTRLRTFKNEEITIPNSTVLSGNTINYSVYARNQNSEGLIIYTTATVGYDVSWRVAENAFIEAALKTNFVLQEPKPFVLQIALDDFYASYEINVYVTKVEKKLEILSCLRENILDVFNEKGIEIMSPHYRAYRDGSEITIPKNTGE